MAQASPGRSNLDSLLKFGPSNVVVLVDLDLPMQFLCGFVADLRIGILIYNVERRCKVWGAKQGP